MTLGATAVRGLVGPLSVGHGTQKLFGWFGVAALSLAAAVAGSYLVTARSAADEPEAEAPQPRSNGSLPAPEPVGTAT